MYNNQNHWVSGTCPSSSILKTRKRDISETGSLVGRFRLALSKGPNGVSVPSRHLKTETDPVSETLCFLGFRIPGYGQSRET
jgi:hypothetical protein